MRYKIVFTHFGNQNRVLTELPSVKGITNTNVPDTSQSEVTAVLMLEGRTFRIHRDPRSMGGMMWDERDEVMWDGES